MLSRFVKIIIDSLLDNYLSLKSLFAEFTDTITFLLLSSCNRYLVASDATGNIVIWTMKKNIWEYYCKLPKHKNPPTAMAVHNSTLQLIVAYSDLKVRITSNYDFLHSTQLFSHQSET